MVEVEAACGATEAAFVAQGCVAFVADEVAFVAALDRALPGVGETELRWRFNFVVGAMVQLLNFGAPPGMDESNFTLDERMQFLQAFCIAGLGWVAVAMGGSSAGWAILGASNSYTAEIDGFQVTAVGEVPGITVQRIASSMRRQ